VISHNGLLDLNAKVMILHFSLSPSQHSFLGTHKRPLLMHIGIVDVHTEIVDQMAEPKLMKLELQIMDTLWTRGTASIREIQETFSEKGRPAYTTIQTTVYRLEDKKAVRRIKKVGNFHIFEAAVSRDSAQRKLIDDLLARSWSLA
jgi:predicted transcriptional regulator